MHFFCVYVGERYIRQVLAARQNRRHCASDSCGLCEYRGVDWLLRMPRQFLKF